VTDPYDVKKTEALLKEKLDAEGVNVVISRRHCVFVARRMMKAKKESTGYTLPEQKAP
jgi:TPP-dependent indolepyruvate ferredoxin oxidoreductase alpha subunit